MSGELQVLKDYFKKQNVKIKYKLYFKRRATNGSVIDQITGYSDYETNWQEIPNDKIISYGAISHNASGANLDKINQGSFSLKLANNDGYFNSENSQGSFFYGYASIYKTLVKIEFYYLDSDYSYINSDNILFTGFISDNIAYDSEHIVTFTIEPMENILKLFDAASSLYLSASKFNTREIFDLFQWSNPRTTRNYFFSPMFSINSFCGRHGLNEQWGTNFLGTSTIENTSCYDLIKKSAQQDGMKLISDRNGKIWSISDQLNTYYEDIADSSITSECLFHNKCDSDFAKASTIHSNEGPDISLSAAWTAGSFSAVKYGNGINLSPYNYGVITNIPNFNYNKFTFEGWFKCAYTISCGVIHNGSERVLLAQFSTGSFTDFSTVNCHGEYAFGFGTGSDASSTAYNALSYTFNQTGVAVAFGNCVANVTAVSVAPGESFFIALSWDADGINGTNEFAQIWFGLTSTSISKVASMTLGSFLNETLYQFLGVPYISTSTIYLGTSANTVGALHFDNLKIYNYPKSSFPDIQAESNFSKIQKAKFNLNLRTGADDEATNILKKYSISKEISKVYNRVSVKYIDADTTTSYANVTETFTPNDGSSSDKYGIRKLEYENYYLTTSNAAYLAQKLYDDYHEPKNEIQLSTVLYPYLNILDVVRVNLQSDPISLGDAFDSGFDSGFGWTTKELNISDAEYQILKISHNIQKSESQFLLREV
jgi:hypothetical protein